MILSTEGFPVSFMFTINLHCFLKVLSTKSASVLKRSKHTTDQFESLDFMPELTIVSKLLCILDA